MENTEKVNQNKNATATFYIYTYERKVCTSLYKVDIFYQLLSLYHWLL